MAAQQKKYDCLSGVKFALQYETDAVCRNREIVGLLNITERIEVNP